MSHVCAAVGTPFASTQGAAMKRWPVAWNTKLPVDLSVAVYRDTWQVAHNDGLRDGVPCVPMIESPALIPGGNQPARPSSVGPSGEWTLFRVVTCDGSARRW